MIKVIPNRKIVCKACGIEQQSKEYPWRVKNDVVTLDVRTCRTCSNKDRSAISKHKKLHPKPLNSRCQCCNKVAKLHCDHSHSKSKKFRGWLCSKCNVGIGYLGDNIVGVKLALKYLEKIKNKK